MGGEKKGGMIFGKTGQRNAKLQMNRDGAKDGPSTHHDQSSRSQAKKA